MEVSDDIQRLLKQVADHFDLEDKAVRERQIRTWRKLKLYWNSFTNIWYDEVAHDWRIWDEQQQADDHQGAYYDKPVNVFRAYLESIIAALSVTIPSIKCYPDDADNSDDLETAKAGDRIADLVYKHNNVQLLWLHALYIYCTEGLIACYSYPKEDESYGTYDKKEYEDTTEEQYVCPECQSALGDDVFTDSEKDEYMPDDDDVELHDAIENKHETVCPQCGAMLDPSLQKTPYVVQRLVGITQQPKTRQCMEVYGGLYVKVPNYVMKQPDTPYLRFSYETHYSCAIERFPHLANKLGPSNSMRGSVDQYEAWARLSPQYNTEYPTNTITINNYWFRPWAFNVLNEEDAKKLKKKFPDGAKYIKINECYASACNESLDDCWTLTHNPLSDYLHHDPLGMLLTSIQDITNDLVSLVLQTIEHGIPQTFADPSVLNFNAYKQSEVAPGSIFPAKPATGKGMGDAFYEVKTATLSQEVLPFSESIQQFGQLVSGALPSLFGGQQEGSKTASEYSMSKSSALQRLQTPWKMLTIWWKEIFGKVIPSYIKDVVEDEHYVQKDQNGDFINVFIRKAQLQGKIGNVELEASENLPMTWMQKKDVIMQLMQATNPEILAALASPENLPLLSEAIGLEDFSIPGEADRTKQYEEIKMLINSQPIEMPPDPMMMQQSMTMGAPPPQPQSMPSVEVDPIVDNHQVESEICRTWAISLAGRQCKIENPQGYQNVLLHMKAHLDIVAQQAMQQMMMQAQPSANGAGAKPAGNSNNQQAAAPKNNKGMQNGSGTSVQ